MYARSLLRFSRRSTQSSSIARACGSIATTRQHTQNHGPGPASQSIDPKEAAKFAKLADTWWKATGPFAPLHALNPVRCEFIRTSICYAYGLDAKSREPLLGLSVLDVGCGGGILSESLARMGAAVTGIDISHENVAAATMHAHGDPMLASRIRYECVSAEACAAAGRSWDVVVASEVVEHVRRPDEFLRVLTSLLRQDASCAPLVLSTLNRTPASWALAIVAAEYVSGAVPRGTHSWEKFITPAEMALMARGAGLQVTALSGMRLTPLLRPPWASWTLATHDTSVNYIAMLQRPAVLSDPSVSAAAAGGACKLGSV